MANGVLIGPLPLGANIGLLHVTRWRKIGLNKGVREEYAEWVSGSVDLVKIMDKEPILCPDYGTYG